MDVLSDVVRVARTGRPHSARVVRIAPFGRRFSAVPAAGFHVVLQGTCWLLPPQGAPIPLAPGDVVFLPRGSAHGLADNPATPLTTSGLALTDVRPSDVGTELVDRPATVMLCGAYLMDRDGQHPLLDDIPEVVHLPTRVGGHAELRAAIDLLGAELDRRPGPGADAALLALLDLLLLYILRAWLEQRQASGVDATLGWGAALLDPAIATALQEIHGDPGQGWTVGQLATRARLSRAAFARRFTRLVGRPPLTYLTWWRMTTAARLLRTCDSPVHTVARQVGYTSVYAFTHAFKRQYGAPPGVYRRDAADPGPLMTGAPRRPNGP